MGTRAGSLCSGLQFFVLITLRDAFFRTSLRRIPAKFHILLKIRSRRHTVQTTYNMSRLISAKSSASPNYPHASCLLISTINGAIGTSRWASIGTHGSRSRGRCTTVQAKRWHQARIGAAFPETRKGYRPQANGSEVGRLRVRRNSSRADSNSIC